MKFLLIILILSSCVKAPISDERMITGKGKKIKPAKVIYLHFGDYLLTGTAWNQGTDISLQGANLPESVYQRILDSVKWDFRDFDVLVTCDSSQYHIADPKKRVRVFITKSYEWYGYAGGVAYVNSFTWGDTPCFVFSTLLGNSEKSIAETISHEAGHTLGLRHQSTWMGGERLELYSTGANGVSPIMGNSMYSVRGEWITGTDQNGSIQNDEAIIRETLKKNEFSNQRQAKVIEE